MTDNPFEIGSDDARHDIRWHPGGANVSAKALAWSLAAAYAHCFCYSYSYLVFFLRRRNESFGWGCDPKYFLPTPIPTPDEYLDILEFRKSQLERALVNTSSEWCWPEEWGGPSWNTQIIYGIARSLPHACASLDTTYLHLVETRHAIRVHQFLLSEGGPRQFLMSLDREKGLKDIRAFTSGTTKLIVIDPYAYAGESRESGRYVSELAKATHLPKLKALHVVFSSSRGNTALIRKGIARVALESGAKFTDTDSDLIHDRIWIADRERALVVGTSFGGLGSKAAFLLPLPSTDLKELLRFLDERRLV